MSDTYCTKHEAEHKTTELTTGTYEFCVECADETIEKKMVALRVELANKGYLGYSEYASEDVA